MRPRGMPRTMKTAQEALRDRLFAGFLARAYRSQARDGMRLLWRAPMRIEEQGRSRIKAMERISEPIIGGKIGRGVLLRPRMAASRRPDPQNERPNAFHFSLTADESTPVADVEAPRTRWGSRSRRTGIAMGHATCLKRRGKTTKYPQGISIGGEGLIFEFDAQRSVSSRGGSAALERAIMRRNVRPRIDAKPAPHTVTKSPNCGGVSR